jgi:hypothetical protein
LLLRLGILGCFAGHGIWSLLGKQAWVPFFRVFFLSDSMAVHLMPVVETVDIAIGLWAFFLPMQSVLAWAAFWTFFTACLRPSAGMGMSEFFERAANYGIPLTFLAIASLLMGHGGLAFFVKKTLLLDHFASIGLALTPGQLQLFGLFEMALGLLVLLRPRWMGLMAFVLVYKLATESLHPIAGSWIDILETLERMGDYVAPLAVIVLLRESVVRTPLPPSRPSARTHSFPGRGSR